MPVPGSFTFFFIGALAAALFGSILAADPSQSGWQWSWVCNSGKCVRSDRPATSPRAATGTSQAICKLACGKYGALWPQPTGQTSLSPQVVAFHPSSVVIEGSRVAKDFVQRIGKLWQSQLFSECGADCSLVPRTQVTVYISVTKPDLTLNWDTDESYTLDVATKDTQVNVKIKSPTVFGARHGLETLGQLITRYTATAGSSRSGQSTLVIVSQAHIVDAPKFSHRGLLLDTARNFLPISAITRTIDGMAHVKLNVLHWHATDTQSFPLNMPRVPNLALYGAYSSEKSYSYHDVAQVIEYAKLRGVRVIIEIDAPAHSGNGWQWGEAAGLGELAVCLNKQPWRSYCIQPPCGQLNPANANVYALLRDLYADLISLLPPGEVLHMGGDEVFFPCWNSSQEIVSYLEQKGQGRTDADFLQLWSDFQATSLRVVDEVNPAGQVPVILWSSHLTDPSVISNFLSKDRYIIQTWVEANKTLNTDLLAQGYRLIISTKDKWYLDHGFWGITTYHQWRVAYDNKLPVDKLVLGGEAAMWGELVDELSLDPKVWPRAAAVAERLWSNPTSSSIYAEPRLQQLRNRLKRRGLRPDAISPEYCSQSEAECF